MDQALFKRIQFPCNYFMCKLAGWPGAGMQPTTPSYYIGGMKSGAGVQDVDPGSAWSVEVDLAG